MITVEELGGDPDIFTLQATPLELLGENRADGIVIGVCRCTVYVPVRGTYLSPDCSDQRQRLQQHGRVLVAGIESDLDCLCCLLTSVLPCA